METEASAGSAVGIGVGAKIGVGVAIDTGAELAVGVGEGGRSGVGAEIEVGIGRIVETGVGVEAGASAAVGGVGEDEDVDVRAGVGCASPQEASAIISAASETTDVATRESICSSLLRLVERHLGDGWEKRLNDALRGAVFGSEGNRPGP